MINYKNTCFIFVGTIFLFLATNLVAQEKKDFSDASFYEKKEFNTGFLFYGNNEREELRTDVSDLYEEIASGFPAFQFKSSFWNFLDYKQDFLEFNFEVGPFYGLGNSVDSTFIKNIESDLTQFGVRANFSVDYSSRYYYNDKNYTILEVGAWARSQMYKQNSKGSAIDSSGIVSNIDESSSESKFRYGFEAKAGWGWGRLNPMNNYMLAQYILGKYYAGRIFSEVEIRRVATEIYTIKGDRNIVNGHNNEQEAQIISDFLNENMLLTLPDNLEVDWQLGEFKPRMQGARIEIGPFFKYFNREPDFIFGGYIQYVKKEYRSLKWNRNFSAGINYNRYKKQDWVLAELNIGWTYFPNLKKQFDFGVKYVPGVQVNNFTEMSGFNHGFVPYVGYFSQINSKLRVNLTFAYRISHDEKIMLPGPEFSLAIYRSRY